MRVASPEATATSTPSAHATAAAQTGAAERIAGSETPWGAEWMPRARAVTFEGPHGPVHAYDFPPTNPGGEPADELPPYIVLVHGGPTAHSAGAASGQIAYFTSRGIGVLDVNYGGSTGYGRDYRERLRGQWGVVDVDDVAAAALGLAPRGGRSRAHRDRGRLGGRMDGARRPREHRRFRRRDLALRRRRRPRPGRRHA